ncbi:MAG: hypothetical protein ACRDYA_17980 [Egibacteraceae bacterium]
MRQIGLASYAKRLPQAAETLVAQQGHDGGWGLTLTSVSSIVNTSEALAVLRSAGVGGKQARDAVDYLASVIGDHCRPRQRGGRGENARFVCFGLSGLIEYAQFFRQPGVPEAVAWCVGWLERHQVEHGWPEVAGIDDTSLHQTALAVIALTRLRETLTELGPDLMLAGGVDTTALLVRVDPLIAHGLGGLLYHRRSSGAWGWRTYVDTAPSPSKTSLCLLAAAGAAGRLTAAHPIDPDRDFTLEVGGVDGKPQATRVSEVVAKAGQWLLGNHQRWETFVEDDQDVQGTAWEHMTYALGVQAVLRAGGAPYDPRLATAWRLMNDLWDSEAGMWGEPGSSGRRVTIRAAYSTVCAYDEARLRVSEMGMAEQPSLGTAGPGIDGPQLEIHSIRLDEGDRRIHLATGEATVTCELSERLFRLAQFLATRPILTVPEIAAALHVAECSVAKYVQRLNRAVAETFGGSSARLIMACKTPHGSGYKLALTPPDRGRSQARSLSIG